MADEICDPRQLTFVLEYGALSDTSISWTGTISVMRVMSAGDWV